MDSHSRLVSPVARLSAAPVPTAQDVEADELAKRLPREVMLDHRAQLFEAINLEKALISRRRGGLVYKHISIIDLKVRRAGAGGLGLGGHTYSA